MNALLEKKIEESKKILRLASDMSDHYYHKPLIICYSGGKDSDVILRLAMECLNKDQFEVLHSVTTVDSPITNRYVNDIFKEIKEKDIKCEKFIPLGRDGKPTNMWKLIVEKQLPPTRLARYCCQTLKEVSTPNRVAVVGVREAESTMRQNRDVFGVRGKSRSQATFFSLDHTKEVHKDALEREDEPNGSVWDCTLIKAMKEKKDTIVSPIYKWSDSEVWDYLRERQYPYNPMYDMGYHRVGCVGCPLATYRQKMKEFNDFPYFKTLYINAFQKMLDARKEKEKSTVNESWKTGEEVFNWWIEEYRHNVKGQMTLEWEDE